MFRIATQPPETASGPAALLYAQFPRHLGVPAPLLLLSASPRLLAAHAALLGYYGAHPRLGFELLAAIRFIAARVLAAPDCLDHARRTLLACGLAPEEIEALPEPLPEALEGGGEAFFQAEALLLRFVQRVLARPGLVDDADVARLRLAGWDDATILDALAHAAAVQTPALLLRALKR